MRGECQMKSRRDRIPMTAKGRHYLWKRGGIQTTPSIIKVPPFERAKLEIPPERSSAFVVRARTHPVDHGIREVIRLKSNARFRFEDETAGM